MCIRDRLVSFNRTLNRLTKPVTALIALSLLSSAFISCFDYFNKVKINKEVNKGIKGIRVVEFMKFPTEIKLYI